MVTNACLHYIGGWDKHFHNMERNGQVQHLYAQRAKIKHLWSIINDELKSQQHHKQRNKELRLEIRNLKNKLNENNKSK
jgi:hypothetical protein